MNKYVIDLADFQIDEDITLDDGEEILLSGLKDSKSIMNENIVSKLSEIAKNQNKRSKHINMRLTETDYMLAKAKAIEEGIPYQVLLASVIHKWLHSSRGKFN